MQRPKVAIGKELCRCKSVITLGVKPNFEDYTPEEQKLIREAEIIYYPTFFYAGLLRTMGKRIFPSYECYLYACDKIKQTTLFKLLDIPHPRTRIFYGPRQKRWILNYFSYPFIAKIPRGSSRGTGVFLIKNEKDLAAYNKMTHIAYIQEYLPIDRDIRVVIIKDRIVLAYWRIKKRGEFRCNLAQGATISFNAVPKPALDLALKTAKLCKLDNVGIDICFYEGRYYVLEANMKYGLKAFALARIDYEKMLAEMVEKEIL